MTFKGSQFGRFAKLEIKNFITKELITIPDDFEIEFEFFKTIDEVDNASRGTVKIQGLTPETYKKINSDGGQIKLVCGYTNSTIKTLFVADIARMQQRSVQGTTETIIECSANLLNYYYTSGYTTDRDKVTLLMILDDYSKRDGADKFGFALSNIDKTLHKPIIDYVITAEFQSPQFFGMNNRQILESMCSSYGLDLAIDYSDDLGKVYTFSLKASNVSFILDQVNSGYVKIDNKTIGKSESINDMFITPSKQYKEVVVLSNTTGFLSGEVEYRIANALETQELASNESQTEKSKQKILDSDAKRQAQALKDAKRKADGKKVKAKVNKVRTIKVNRKYIRITALLNPDVKPQGHVEVITKQPDYNGIFRVREVTYKGNNKSGNWEMVLFCEDSSGRYDSTATERDISSNEQDESLETENNGSLGNNTSYGASTNDQGADESDEEDGGNFEE